MLPDPLLELHRGKLDGLGFEITQKLGEGGMAFVYKVHHRDPSALRKTQVAKVMKPWVAKDSSLRERLREEASKLNDVRHVNIASLYDFKDDKVGFAAIFMEFIDGVNLLDVIKNGASPSVPNPPSIPMTVEIALQSVAAIECLHENGWAHRDISPDNIMLARRPQGPLVKLIDLGIAKDVREQVRNTTGVWLGKPHYASPEQLLQLTQPSLALTPATDIYSFGVVLYQLLTGRMPVRGADNAEIMNARTSRLPIPFEETDPQGRVPGELRALVLNTMNKDAARRPTAAELLEQLRPFRAPRDIDPGELDRLMQRARAQQGTEYLSTGEWESRLKARAKEHETKFEYAEATRILEDILKVLPVNPTVQARIAEIRRKKEQDEEIQTLIREGQALLLKEKLPEARAKLEQARALNSAHPRLPQLADAIVAAEKAECARHVETARKWLDQEGYDKAEEAVARALELRPNDSAANALRGEIPRLRKAKAREVAGEAWRLIDQVPAEVRNRDKVRETLAAAKDAIERLKDFDPGHGDLGALQADWESHEKAVRDDEMGEVLARQFDQWRPILERGNDVDPLDPQAVASWKSEADKAVLELSAVAEDQRGHRQARELVDAFRQTRARIDEAIAQNWRAEVETALEGAAKLLAQRRFREASAALRSIGPEIRRDEALAHLRTRLGDLQGEIRRRWLRAAARVGAVAVVLAAGGLAGKYIVEYIWKNRNALVRLYALPQGTQEEIQAKLKAVEDAKLRYEEGSESYELLNNLEEALFRASKLDAFVSNGVAKSATPVEDAQDCWGLLKVQLARIEDEKAVEGLREAAYEDLCRLPATVDSEALLKFLAREGIPCR